MLYKKTIRFICLCLSLIFSHLDLCRSSLPAGTQIATSNGLVSVEMLGVGDKVLGYDLNETDPNKRIIEVAVINIDKHLADSIFTLYTTEGGWVEASPQQLFFTLESTVGQAADQVGKILVMDFVQAQYITTDYMLIDEHLTCVPITKAVRTELRTTYPQQYSEKIKRNRRNEITSIEKRIVNIDTYAIEVEEPHILLISDRSCDKTTSKPRLLLTHNGIPALAVGVSLAFGSTPASLSLAGVSASVGGLGVTLGPVGVALGVATGLGLLGYQLFKGNKKQETSFYIERSSSGGPGGLDPKDPKDDEDDASIKSLIKAKHLPTDGKIRYVPPKGLKPAEGLPQARIGNDKAFIDRFGNKWLKGPSRTMDEPFEWDVQLSNQGRTQLGWASKNGNYINVSLKGRITH